MCFYVSNLRQSSEVPYSTNQQLVRNFFYCFLQQKGSRYKEGALDYSEEGFHLRGPRGRRSLKYSLTSFLFRPESKQIKMFEEISKIQGFNHITENILIKLDVESLWKCRIVCKNLHQFITSLEKSRKLKVNDLEFIRRIRRQKFLTHSNWREAFNLICQEDNFFRRRGLIELLETYVKQDKILSFDGPIIDSYLNTSKFISLD